MNTESDDSYESYCSVSGSPEHAASQDTKAEAIPNNDVNLSWDYDTEHRHSKAGTQKPSPAPSTPSTWRTPTTHW